MTPSSQLHLAETPCPRPFDEHIVEEEPWRGPPASAWVLVAVALATLGPMLMAVVLASP